MKEIYHSSSNISSEDINNIDLLLKSGNVSSGSVQQMFLNKTAEYIGCSNLMILTSGSASIVTALKTLNLKINDEVIVPNYCCRDVLDAVIACQLQPVLCDVEEDRCLSLDKLSRVITPKTKAIIYVATFGIVKDLSSIKSLGLPIIEDASHCFTPIEYSNVEASGRGDLIVYSFQGTKCLTTGEGGALALNNLTLEDSFKEIRSGFVRGLKLNHISDISACLGLSQISRYEKSLQRRLSIARKYISEINKITKDFNPHNIYFRFPIETPDSYDDIKSKYFESGIHVRKGVDQLLSEEIKVPGRFPVSEQLFRQTVCLPIYPSLNDEEIEHIINTSNEIL